MSRVRTLFWIGVDCIFPLPTPLTANESSRHRDVTEKRRAESAVLVAQLRSDADHLKSHLANCEQLLQSENDRRQSVDSRLTTIIGLSSIAGTIVLGTMLTPHDLRGVPKMALACGLLYLALQVSSAIHAAVRGLGRLGYLVTMPPDILPGLHEAETVHLRRRIATSLEVLTDHQERTNSKVTWMAAAHRAVINFIVGMLFLAGLGTWQGLTTAPPPDPLVERLQKDRALRELLRGPAGPVGPSGPMGIPGSPGPMGKCGGCKSQ